MNHSSQTVVAGLIKAFPFPDPRACDDRGLLAYGGDLGAERIAARDRRPNAPDIFNIGHGSRSPVNKQAQTRFFEPFPSLRKRQPVHQLIARGQRPAVLPAAHFDGRLRDRL